MYCSPSHLKSWMKGLALCEPTRLPSPTIMVSSRLWKWVEWNGKLTSRWSVLSYLMKPKTWLPLPSRGLSVVADVFAVGKPVFVTDADVLAFLIADFPGFASLVVETPDALVNAGPGAFVAVGEDIGLRGGGVDVAEVAIVFVDDVEFASFDFDANDLREGFFLEEFDKT